VVKNERHGDHGTVHAQATILMVAITVLLALLVYLLFRMPPLDWAAPLSSPPPLFVITSIIHESDRPPYGINYDSRVILYHNGTVRFENDDLKAVFYRNGAPVACSIETLNGHLFIGTHHTGVEKMWGFGCSSPYWNPGERIGIDLTDGTFRPGDRVRVDIIQKSTARVVSRHTVTA